MLSFVAKSVLVGTFLFQLGACSSAPPVTTFDKLAACEAEAGHALTLYAAESLRIEGLSDAQREHADQRARESEYKACLMAHTEEDIACEMLAKNTGEHNACRQRARLQQKAARPSAPELSQAECSQMMAQVARLAGELPETAEFATQIESKPERASRACMKTVSRPAYNCTMPLTSILDLAPCDRISAP
jgi:hypothetical protein